MSVCGRKQATVQFITLCEYGVEWQMRSHAIAMDTP